jgi:hypothetical protein
MRQWGEKRDHLYYMTEIGSLNKKKNEIVVDFNRIFRKLYNNIPIDVKSSQPTTKITYVGEFEADFSMMLRERISPTFLIMKYDAIDIQGNMISSGKIKQRMYQVDKDKNKVKEEVDTYDPNRDSQDENIKEMSIFLRNLSNKLSRF